MRQPIRVSQQQAGLPDTKVIVKESSGTRIEGDAVVPRGTDQHAVTIKCDGRAEGIAFIAAHWRNHIMFCPRRAIVAKHIDLSGGTSHFIRFARGGSHCQAGAVQHKCATKFVAHVDV